MAQPGIKLLSFSTMSGPRLIDPLQTDAPHWPLWGAAGTRALEAAALALRPQPPLMQRAGLSAARLCMALAPHAQRIWVACGPGNNGGDGLAAAAHLQAWGRQVTVSWLGSTTRASADTLAAHAQAITAGVSFADEPPASFDFALDALLGIGLQRRGAPAQGAGAGAGAGADDHTPAALPPGVLSRHLALLRTCPQPVLCLDLPSGLDADTGSLAPLAHTNTPAPDTHPTPPSYATNLIADYAVNTPASGQKAFKNRYCLSFLTLKPGLFTHQGKDAAGQVWFDDLGLHQLLRPSALAPAANGQQVAAATPSAWLLGSAAAQAPARLHASHKGSYGDVLVLGGAPGLTGAALLAARAALHAGAGRVLVGLLGEQPNALSADPAQPELMFRPVQSLLAPHTLAAASVVCGCGGGQAVQAILPPLLRHARHLVLDADALNAIAQDSALQTLLVARGRRVVAALAHTSTSTSTSTDTASAPAPSTVLSPHPLEAARLLGISTAQVQANRLASAQQLAERFGAVVVLKGAGTVVAAQGQLPGINHSGNARLATAGTGDVLAGMLGAALAAPTHNTPAGALRAWQAAREVCAAHGMQALEWPAQRTLTASDLAQGGLRF